VESTAAGGGFTLLAYVAMLLLFILELFSYLGDSPTSELWLDKALDDPYSLDNSVMRINFDIDMYSIECHNLQVAVIDPLDGQPVRALQRDYSLRPVDFYKDPEAPTLEKPVTRVTGVEEEKEKDRHKLEEQDGGAQELDADWASSHDGFKHQHFDHVIKYHDFTVINFFAEWCSHCRQFSPTWRAIAEDIENTNYLDAGGDKKVVKGLKMNCVDFKTTCRQEGIRAFPTIRVYRSDGRSVAFADRRTQEDILGWVEKSVKGHVENDYIEKHAQLQTGCRAYGHVVMPKVPGYLEFFAGGGNHALDPTMTNVSHYVRHLSFSSPTDTAGYFGQYRSWAAFGLPKGQRVFTHPVDGKKFCTKEAHQTFEHHIQVVSTLSSYGQTYQFQHYERLSISSNQSEVPQARFHFDIDTFAIKIMDSDKSMYQFATSTMAILGGTFVMIKLLHTGTHAAAKVAAKAIAPRKNARKHVNSLNGGS